MIIAVLVSIFHRTFLTIDYPSYPKIIWTYFDRKPSTLIEMYTSATRAEITPDWKFIFLNPQTLPNYLNISSFPKAFQRIPPQHKSDYIRLSLLAEYGGGWIDASSIITSKDYIEKIRTRAMNDKVDFVGTCNNNGCPTTYIETGVLYAPHGSLLMKAWLAEVRKVLELGYHKYLYSVFRSGVTLPTNTFWGDRYPTIPFYFSLFAGSRYAVERTIPRYTKLTIAPAASHQYKLFATCNWKPKCFLPISKNITLLRQYPLIKFPSHLRRLIEPGETYIPRNIQDPYPYTPGILLSHDLFIRDELHLCLNVVLFLWVILQLFVSSAPNR